MQASYANSVLDLILPLTAGRDMMKAEKCLQGPNNDFESLLP